MMRILGTWSPSPLITAGLVVAGAVYMRADRRVRRERGARVVPRVRPWFFLGGLVVIFTALESPIDTGAATSFSIHMVQHLMLTMVAAPLLVLGAPILLALMASSRATRRHLQPILMSAPVRILAGPIAAWSLFMMVLWGSHLPAVYELTLRGEGFHAVEHLAFLGTAALFWMPVVGIDPAPSSLPHPARILYLFFAMAAMAFLGLAIFSANHPLYPAYARIGDAGAALADQRVAGALMWTGTMFLIVPALAFVMLDWMREDDKEARRTDARLLRAREQSATPMGREEATN